MTPFGLGLTEAAKTDLTTLHQWYEEQKLGLGTEFFQAFNQTVLVICGTPEAARIRYRAIRSLRIKRFPYAVFYRINHKAKMITVLRIFHQSRRPLDS